MKNLASTVIILSIVLVCPHGALGADAKNDPSQFPLAVHVSGSSYAPSYDFSVFSSIQEIVSATINRTHYRLIGPTSSARTFLRGNGLINPGDYHARLTTDEHKTAYESLQQFEILFPDGSTRRFNVIAQSE